MISVIIPVFNTQKYLNKCIKSVLNQSYRDLEIIIINDGSTDKCDKICKKYSAKDKRIKYISKNKNEGVEKIRLEGINLSEGEQIFFIDSDDWIENKTLELMYNKLLETNSDFVSISYRQVYNSLKIFSKDNVNNSGLLESKSIKEIYTSSLLKNKGGENVIWGKLFKKSLFNNINIQPSGFIYGEDGYLMLKILPKLNRIYFLSAIGYNYRYGGMSSKYNPQIFKDLKNFNLIKRIYCIENNLFSVYDSLLIELKEIFKSEVYWMILQSGKNKKEIISYIKEEKKNSIYNCLFDKSTYPIICDNFLKSIKEDKFDDIYTFYKKEVRIYKLKRSLKRTFIKILNFI